MQQAARPQPPSAAGAPRPERKTLPPLIDVQRRVLAAACRLSAGARLVALVIASHMNVSPDKEGHVSFLTEKTLARESGQSVRTVRDKLREISLLSPTLFVLTRGGVTRGHPHACYSFRLVESPEANERTNRPHDNPVGERSEDQPLGPRDQRPYSYGPKTDGPAVRPQRTYEAGSDQTLEDELEDEQIDDLEDEQIDEPEKEEISEEMRQYIIDAIRNGDDSG